jgi:hypothetical protein
MIRRARLDRLEAALSPTAAICLWLEEAHAFGSYFAYENWSLDQPRATSPILRIPAQVRADVEQRLHGQPRAAVEAAARRADQDAVFRIELVHELNQATTENLRVRALEGALFHCFAYILELDADGPSTGSTRRRVDPAELERLRANLAGNIAGHVIGLLTWQEARHILERRYLGGHAALFPDLAAEEKRLIADASRLAENVRELATCRPRGEDRGPTGGRGPDLRPAALRTAAHAGAPAAAAHRLEMARMRAFDLMGEHANATVVGRRIMRTLSPGPPTA